MNRVVRWSAALGGVAAGVVVARRARSTLSGDGAEAGRRWSAVTVNRAPEAVTPDGQLPDPLATLGDTVEVQVRPAPGGRGTELAARPGTPEPSGVRGAVARVTGKHPRQALRVALRQAKQLLETGEVLQADRPPTARRTLRNLPLELATRRAEQEGRL
jgi:hypothetical protein